MRVRRRNKKIKEHTSTSGHGTVRLRHLPSLSVIMLLLLLLPLLLLLLLLLMLDIFPMLELPLALLIFKLLPILLVLLELLPLFARVFIDPFIDVNAEIGIIGAVLSSAALKLPPGRVLIRALPSSSLASWSE